MDCETPNPVLEALLYRMRDPSTGRPEFRSCLQQAGYHLGTTLAARLPVKRLSVTTVMGTTAHHDVVDEDRIVLLGLFRAGFPLYQGLQDAFPNARAGFVGTARDEETLKSTISYLGIPSLEGIDVLLADTMNATGGSFVDVYDLVRPLRPRRVFAVSAFATREGYDRVREAGMIPHSAVVDPVLTGNGFISPGLGDAGDRCYGEKIDADPLIARLREQA